MPNLAETISPLDGIEEASTLVTECQSADDLTVASKALIISESRELVPANSDMFPLVPAIGAGKGMVRYASKAMVPFVVAPSTVLCAHKEITAILSQKSKQVKALCFMDGSIHYLKTARGSIKTKAALNEIATVLEQVLGLRKQGRVAKRIPLPTLNFERLVREMAGSEVEAAPKIKKRSKLGSRWVQISSALVEQAIEQKSSDLFIDLREAENITHISYKTFGITGRDTATDLSWDEGKRIVTAIWALEDKKEWAPNGTCDVTVSYIADDGRVFRLRGSSMEEDGRDGKTGHSISIRLRDTAEIIALSKAGYTEQQIEDIYLMADAPGGLSLFSGPTDSGKSSSLTSMIHHMPRNMRKIEIADPVEIYTDYATHVDISKMDSEAFSDTLSALVRQNPDFLALGEIRDVETGKAATSMALQGKRVWSTIHCNSCGSVPSRLTQFGLSLNDIGFKDFFTGVINQNLVPVLCKHCALKEHPDKALNDKYLKIFASKNLRYQNESGCKKCRNGMKGQTLVAEVYPLVRSGDLAYEYIRTSNWSALRLHMEDFIQIETKHQVAASRIREGTLDPHLTAGRIGPFDPATPEKWKGE